MRDIVDDERRGDRAAISLAPLLIPLLQDTEEEP